MSRKVYADATVAIGSTDFSSGGTLEASNLTVNVSQNTTPDWEYFGGDWVVNYPTTASWTMSWESVLDDTLGLDLDAIIGSQLTVTAVCAASGGPTYSGTGTISVDVTASRTDYGKASWSVKGSGALSETIN